MVKLLRSSKISERRKRQSMRKGGRPTPNESDSEKNSIFSNQSPEEIQAILDFDEYSPVPDLPLPPIPALPSTPIDNIHDLPTFSATNEAKLVSSNIKADVTPKGRKSRSKKSNVPLGCVQNEYNMTSSKGKKFISKRCVNSKDPKVNDNINCIINIETNRCKKKVN